MSSSLNPEDLQAIVEQLIAISGLNAKEHNDHHEFIELLRKREERIIERNQKIQETVFGWLIIGGITGIGTAVWHYFQYLLNKGG